MNTPLNKFYRIKHSDEVNISSEPIIYTGYKDILILLVKKGQFSLTDMACLLDAFRKSLEKFVRWELLSLLIVKPLDDDPPQTVRMIKRMKTTHTIKFYESFIDEYKWRFVYKYNCHSGYKNPVKRSLPYLGSIAVSFQLHTVMYIIDNYGNMFEYKYSCYDHENLGFIRLVQSNIVEYATVNLYSQTTTLYGIKYRITGGEPPNEFGYKVFQPDNKDKDSYRKLKDSCEENYNNASRTYNCVMYCKRMDSIFLNYKLHNSSISLVPLPRRK
jgi:hypothetical protein